MNSRHRTSCCGAGFSRRDWLRGSAAAIGASLIAPGARAAGIGIPGPYRGRVVSVAHSAAISGGVVQASAVRQMFQMGMLRLTGASTVRDAWSQFVSPTDVVGIKINSASGPNPLSSPQVYAELVAEIASVGVPLSNIVIFDKNRVSFASLNMWSWVPPGVGLMFAYQAADWTWQSTESMDLQCFVDLPYTMAGQSLDDPFNRRSYIALFATQVVTKIVNLAVMKDHNYAGVTLSLKNLSYGMASNVERGHDNPANPHFDVFIPNIVAVAPIRSKVVLNIVDSIQAVYSGGPGSPTGTMWNNKTLYFATDPVALDRVCWKVIDAKRKASGFPPADTPGPGETPCVRQPSYIYAAGAFGLGESNDTNIDLRKYQYGLVI